MIRVVVADNNEVIHDVVIINREQVDQESDLCRYEWEVRGGTKGAGLKGDTTLHHRDMGAAVLVALVMEELGDALAQQVEEAS